MANLFFFIGIKTPSTSFDVHSPHHDFVPLVLDQLSVQYRIHVNFSSCANKIWLLIAYVLLFQHSRYLTAAYTAKDVGDACVTSKPVISMSTLPSPTSLAV